MYMPKGWSEARTKGFIVSALRQASLKWPPKHEAKGRARVNRGEYLCNRCKEIVPASIKNDKGKRVNNIYVDHIIPVVDPEIGFTTWDDFIHRSFVGPDDYQILCKKCHDAKTKEEREIGKLRNKKSRG